MATYIIGDVHGCFQEMQLLLAQVNFDPTVDELYLAGDLIARGEDSLACLRYVKRLGNKAHMVLGNHEMHFLAVAYGLQTANPKDKTDLILQAKDSTELIDWLSQQPLLRQHPEYKFLLSHAGIPPAWDVPQALIYAKEVQDILTSPQKLELLANMYGTAPNQWQDSLTGTMRWRYIINALTRMRYCYTDGSLDLSCKLSPNEAPTELIPWFELPLPIHQQHNIIFGHWASLIGYATPANIYALDSGCIWGNYLTLLRWQDQKFFYQKKLTNT